MDIGELMKERERREKYFKDYASYARRIKRIAEKYFGSVKLYVFGSVVEGDYHVMLSDIDVAVVVNSYEKEKALRLKVEVEKNFGDVFQLHVLSEKEWKFYLNFVKKFVEV